MSDRPNVVFILADQLRAASLPIYGEGQIQTPHLDRLAAEGVTLENAISTFPVCTPYRSMLLTGRHPQSTGHWINFVRTRHDELSVADAFAAAGYRTGWIGKWHLHTGSFPQVPGPDFVPEGRDRLGFQFWRGYNFHAKYMNGWVNCGDWTNEQWEGYETAALNRYGFQFMDQAGDEPFCVFLSPHQPHGTSESPFAPDDCYARVPENLTLPANVPDPFPKPDWQPPDAQDLWWKPTEMYRHYLAMTVALDDMVGEMMDYLERTGRAANTLLVFTSDHGSQIGAQGIAPWLKKMPYEDSLKVPFVMRLPGVLDGGVRRDALTAPVDLFPTLCHLCDVPIPRTVEGRDLADAWCGKPDAFEQDALLTMSVGAAFDYLVDGKEWRGVRTKTHSWAQWLDGRRELFDLRADPLEMTNLADDPAHAGLRGELESRQVEMMDRLGDELIPATRYANWYDSRRRIIRNCKGPLGDPEAAPDFSLLK